MGNSMIETQIIKARLVSYLLYSDAPIGFALPVFCRLNNADGAFIQIIDEIDHIVHHFQLLDPSEYIPLRLVPNLTVSAGDKPIYALIENTNAIIGSLPDISDRLRAFLEEGDASIFS